MDEQGDYPIKVLDMAPLIMVTLPTVSSFFSTCGFFLRDGRSPSGDLHSPYLACGWPLGTNGSPFANGGASKTLGLKILRVQGKGGRTDFGSGPGRPAWADRPRPNSDPARSPLRACGSLGDYALFPLHLHDFGDVILMSNMEVLRA
jgi:hypothetical protein